MNVETYFIEHMLERIKLARKGPGFAERYLPWYGAAGLGGVGAVAGQELAPARYKVPAAIAGSLLGTAAGVHGGEALGRRISESMETKKAAAEQKKPPSMAGVIGRGVLGLGLGTVGGYGAGKALEYVAHKRGKKLHRAAPIVAQMAGAGLSAGYPLWKAYEAELLRRSREKEKTSGRLVVPKKLPREMEDLEKMRLGTDSVLERE